MGEAAQVDFALRELESLIDPEPLITPVLLRTGRVDRGLLRLRY